MKVRLLIVAVITTSLALVFTWTATAETIHTRPNVRPEVEPIFSAKNFHPDISATSAHTIYLPLVSHEIPPCSVAPTLISPTNNSTLDTLVPTLGVERGTTPVSYTVIMIDDDAGFGSPIGYSSWGDFERLWLTLFDNLSSATRYYWYAYDVCGEVESPYSETFSFVTGSGGVILPAPSLVSPPDGTTGTGDEVTVEWTSVSGADGYQVLRCLVDGGCTIYRSSDTSQTLGWLDANTTYEWYVRAYNDYAYGNESDVWQFSTGSFTAAQSDKPIVFDVPYDLYDSASAIMRLAPQVNRLPR